MSQPLPEFVTRDVSGAWRVEVWAQPGGAKDVIAGLRDGRLMVKVRAKAVDNKANEALEAFLAHCLGLKARQVRIDSGRTGRRKTFRVEAGAEPDWSGVLPDGTVR